MLIIRQLVTLLLDFNVTLPDSVPLWLFILVTIIAVAATTFTILIKYSKNVIEVKTHVDGWITSKRETKEQKGVAEDLESRFFKSQSEINSDAGFSVLPFNMKIKWQNRDDVRPIYKDRNQYWIVMKKTEDQAENFVRYVEASVEKNVVSRTRRYLPQEVRRAIDLTLIKKIISIEFEDALEYFDEKIYKPDVLKHNFLNDYVEGLTDLDGKGLFVRSYLREIHDIGLRLFPKTATDENREDVKRLTAFFASVGRRKGQQDIETVFKGKSIRVAVVFVAGEMNNHMLAEFLLHPEKSWFTKKINKHIDENITSIYLLSRGDRFIGLTKSLLTYYNKHEKVASTQQIPFTDREQKISAMVGLIRLRLPHT